MHDGAFGNQRIAFEIHLGDQPLGKGGAKHRDMDMRGAPVVHPVAPRIGAGFHRAEEVIAVLIRQCAPAAAEIGVDGRKIHVLLVPIAPARIRLPDFHKRMRHRAAVFIQHPTVDDDAFAHRISGFGVVLDKVVVQGANIAVAKGRAGDFRHRSLQRQKRLTRAAGQAGLVGLRIGGRMPEPVALVEFGGLHLVSLIAAKVSLAIFMA